MRRRSLLKDSGVDWSKEYLTFIPTVGATTFKYTNSADPTLQYSLDNGSTWTTLYSGSNSPSVAVGQKIMWRGTKTSFGGSNYRTFYSSNKYEACGNPLSIVLNDDFIGVNDISDKNYCFKNLFGNFLDSSSDYTNYLENAQNLYLGFKALSNHCFDGLFTRCAYLTVPPTLPATTLADYCYQRMFYYCTSLTTAPELPATTLASYCYNSMFGSCDSLTTAPELPATTLVSDCYNSMFGSCTSLTAAPELPATTLASGCYSSMFSGCTSLTAAPELPATTLADYCYSSMFYGCTKLKRAPVLPARTLVYKCYITMFNGCSSLKYIKAMFTTRPVDDYPYYTSSWVEGVASSGTFVKNSDATWYVRGTYGIPSGWTIKKASE